MSVGVLLINSCILYNLKPNFYNTLIFISTWQLSAESCSKISAQAFGEKISTKKLTAGFGNVSTGKSTKFKHIKDLVVLSKYIEALIECHVFNLPCSYKKWVYVDSKWHILGIFWPPKKGKMKLNVILAISKSGNRNFKVTH